MDADNRLFSSMRGGEPPLGAHLVTPRRGYCHHGIYVGEGRVVHYAGLCRAHYRGPVEEVSLEYFAAGHAVWVSHAARPQYAGIEAVHRARSRIGENNYRLLTNNCEHFCRWCLYGENRSEQVEAWLDQPLVALRFVMNLLLGMERSRPGFVLFDNPI